MKKLISIVLILVLALSLVACGGSEKKDSDKVREYVDKHGADLCTIMEQSITQGSGMTCTSKIKAVGSTIVFDININELDNLTAAQRSEIQANYDAQSSSMSSALKQMQTELPELSGMTINVCEGDGDFIAKLVID